jgi:anti-sigma F factor
MNRMEVKFDAVLENEPFARTVVASFIAPMNPTMDELIEIKTILSEGVTNAMIHGYEGITKQEVKIKVVTENREITITIEDKGKGIENIEQAKIPLFTTKGYLERSGMGLTIIESLSDRLEIHSSIGLGTTLVIHKMLKEEQSVV